eukprot:CAMPEP_0201735916 /NCGR_PEP_ID=MMETSP0593-20130828/38312_1 /ASSEMBLY_ACC=CAM_ASM_000672 /TAXON_ID=267983 /ORGANISM="Skeletonema japonicum, Strain CCMP2506" /LENGTH=57 /DNA_ID=CAMNT_0048229555 /DNA_START=37 /DNA_END=207 /DNA_ORIENTATION=-
MTYFREASPACTAVVREFTAFSPLGLDPNNTGFCIADPDDSLVGTSHSKLALASIDD